MRGVLLLILLTLLMPAGAQAQFSQPPGAPASAQAATWGTGLDGTVSITSGTVTLTRDMDYANLTIGGTGVLKPNGFRIRVAGVLDLSAAQAGAINLAVNAGNAATGASGAAAQPSGIGAGSTLPLPVYTLAAGGTGNTTTGTNPTGSNPNVGVGFVGGSAGGGAGGAGVSAGGAGGVGQTLNQSAAALGPSIGLYSSQSFNPYMAPVAPGLYGGPGGQGGGDGSATGGGGGGEGPAGGMIWIAARFIQRGTNPAAGIISANGGSGGAGGNASGGNAGGGGGGGGGSGGTVWIEAEQLLGSQITGAITANGGAGGSGGAGSGTGKGGQGGRGGGSGAIWVGVIGAGVSTTQQPFSTGGTASTATGTAGTAGGAGAAVSANL